MNRAVNVVIVVAMCLVFTQFPATSASAGFTNTATSSGSTISAATLAAPTGLGLTPNGNIFSCAVNLVWSIPVGSIATGWVVQRYSGSTPIGAPQTLGGVVTNLLDGSGISLLTPYTWKVHATLGNWVSPDATFSYTLTSACL